MLTPLDIQNAAFHRSWRGYNEEEVDDFLDRVFLEYEQLYRENLELKEKLEQKGTVPSITSPKSAYTPPTPATPVFDEEIIGDAKRKAEEIISQAQQQVAREKARLEELKQQRRMFKEQFQSMLQTFFHILKNHESEDLDSTLVMKNLEQSFEEKKSTGTDKL